MSNNRTDRQGIRRSEAEERQTEWESLTPKEQLSVLDQRLGKGKGAVKQRARIAKAIEKAQVKS